MLFSVIIPVYNSVETLKIIDDELFELFQNREDKYELIFVNDSPANLETCVQLINIASKRDNVQVITMKKNSGQQFALLSGMNVAEGDYVITMDDDLQTPVSEIPKLIDSIINDTKVDAVFAIPQKNKKKHCLYRNFGSFFINRIADLYMDKPKHIIGGPFKICKKSVIDYVVSNYNATPNISTLFFKATKNVKNIYFQHNARTHGKSGYSFSKLLKLALNNIINYTSLPLSILGFLGLVTFIISLIFILIIIVAKLWGNITVPGYSSIVVITLFFGSINLIGIGLIGEYLIRILKEFNKPKLDELYIIKDEVR